MYQDFFKKSLKFRKNSQFFLFDNDIDIINYTLCIITDFIGHNKIISNSVIFTYSFSADKLIKALLCSLKCKPINLAINQSNINIKI